MPAAYKCCRPFSRATLLVLVWSVLIYGFVTFLTNPTTLLPITHKIQTGVSFVSIGMSLVVMLVAGLLGDARMDGIESSLPVPRYLWWQFWLF